MENQFVIYYLLLFLIWWTNTNEGKKHVLEKNK